MSFGEDENHSVGVLARLQLREADRHVLQCAAQTLSLRVGRETSTPVLRHEVARRAHSIARGELRHPSRAGG